MAIRGNSKASKAAFRRMPKESRKSLKLWADGCRESVLMPHIEPYADAMERGWSAERAYLEKICNEYHARIDWRLLDHEEPPLPLAPYNPDAILPEEALTDTERQTKIERIKHLNERIRRWLKYRVKRLRRYYTSNRMDPRKNPYSVLLSKLSGVHPPTKARQAYQQFMRERYREDIEGPVKEAWGIKLRRDHLSANSIPDAAFRAKIAREVFNKLPPEEQVNWAKKAREIADEAKGEYEAKLKKPKPTTAEEKQICIDNIPAFLGPIINGIQEMTDLKFCILYGGPFPCNGGAISTNHVHYGRSAAVEPQYFFQHNRNHFENQILGHFKSWLATCYTEEETTGQAGKSESTGLSYTRNNNPNSESDSDTGDSSDSDSDISSSSDDEEGPTAKRIKDASGTAHKPKKKKKGSSKSKSAAPLPTTSAAPPPTNTAVPYSPYDPACPDGPLILPDYAHYSQVKAFTTAQNERNLKALANETRPTIPSKRKRDPPAPPRVIQDTIIGTPTPSPAVSSATPALRASPEGDTPATLAELTDVEMTSTSPQSASTIAALPSPPPENNAEPLTSQAIDPPTTNGPVCPMDTYQEPSQMQPNDAMNVDQTAQPQTGSNSLTSPAETPSSDQADPLPICPSNAPAWLHEALGCVSHARLGPHFTDILRLFLAIEAGHGYKNPNRGLPAKGRPDELQTWIATRRWRGKEPVVRDLDRFSQRWWSWWASFQPLWRTKHEGLLKITESYGEDWDTLMHPGQNGLLSVVACLFWWGLAVNGVSVPGPAHDSWTSAVADVNWIFRGLLEHLDRQCA